MNKLTEAIGGFIRKYGKWMLLGASGLISIGIGIFEEREQEECIREAVEEEVARLMGGTSEKKAEEETEEESDSEDEEEESEDEEEA